VLVDGSGTPNEQQVSSWANRYNLVHPVVADGSRALYNYVNGFPTYIVIDREMVVDDADMYPFNEWQVESLF
jgi:hypothetical protein